MGASLAVLAADLPPMERIVAETGAGLLYPVGSTEALAAQLVGLLREPDRCRRLGERDRKSTRLNSSHLVISYAVFCLKKKKALPTLQTSMTSSSDCSQGT